MRLLLQSVLLLATVSALGQTSPPKGTSAAQFARKPGSTISRIVIAKSNIQITGSFLSRVEVWIEPTGTGTGESLVGEAKRITPAGAHERWDFPIASLPGYPDAVMAVNAFAKAYGRNDKEVGRKSLGFKGVSEFNAALHARAAQ